MNNRSGIKLGLRAPTPDEMNALFSYGMALYYGQVALPDDAMMTSDLEHALKRMVTFYEKLGEVDAAAVQAFSDGLYLIGDDFRSAALSYRPNRQSMM